MPERVQWPIVAVLLLAVIAASCSGGQPTLSGNNTFHWQLTGDLDPIPDAVTVDIDGFETNDATVGLLNDSGHTTICYISAGSWEEWRPDANLFPTEMIGKPLDGWPGERWLDIRDLDRLASLMEARVQMCARKGFDAIEFDNVAAFSNDSGFDISPDDQLAFNRRLASMARSSGLSPGLKNDPTQVEDLVGDFDWSLVEECVEFGECESYLPFVNTGKTVFDVEYTLPLDEFCPVTSGLGFVGVAAPLALDGAITACP